MSRAGLLARPQRIADPEVTRGQDVLASVAHRPFPEEAARVQLHPGEPSFAPWCRAGLREVVDVAVRRAAGADRPALLAVDGRSSGGKTTLSRRIAAAHPGTSVVHTDDIAWWHSRFGWTDLLEDGVLHPVRRGEAVSYRPPAWDARGRTGSIDVPSGAHLLVVEGIGAGRAELAPLFDLVLWVQSDADEAARRDVRRVAAGENTSQGAREWRAEEMPFVTAARTWEHADLAVAGTPPLAHDPAEDVVVGRVGWAALRPDCPPPA